MRLGAQEFVYRCASNGFVNADLDYTCLNSAIRIITRVGYCELLADFRSSSKLFLFIYLFFFF